MLLKLLSPTLRYTHVTLTNPHLCAIPCGVTAVIGCTGAGKTTFANIIERGRNFMTNHIEPTGGSYPSIRTIVFNDIHSLAGFHVEYYQQRYESMMNDDVPTVAQVLGDRLTSPQWSELISRLRISDISDKRLNYLSSGELRKMLIINMLFDLPDVLILDNPFIGLDAPSRATVSEMIGVIASQGISVLLLVSDTSDIPECATAALPIRDMTLGQVVMRAPGEQIEDFRRKFDYLFDFRLDANILALIVRPTAPRPHTTEPIISLRDCRVAYGDRVLVDSISWDIHRGECWALSGPNGSGKSTLLSLINADNPQAYSNDVWLFGQKRGMGHSIWEIKSRIGFLSPELHLYYGGVRNTVRTVISEGFNRVLGSFAPLTDDEQHQVGQWISLFGLESISDVPFIDLSAGEQRLVLLLRAIVRQPEVLILDEPVHGLDQNLKLAVRQVVNALTDAGATIIYVTHCPDEVPQCITHSKVLTAKTDTRP